MKTSPQYWLLVEILAVWRITHLLVVENGPSGLLMRLRMVAGAGLLGGILNCFYCLSLWIAMPFGFMLGTNWYERLLLWPALSGAAILLERLTDRHGQLPGVSYFEDAGTQEKTDVLLRR